MHISRLKVKYEQVTRGFVPRNVTPNADFVSLGRNCSYKVRLFYHFLPFISPSYVKSDRSIEIETEGGETGYGRVELK
jgi:hypothetical protein